MIQFLRKISLFGSCINIIWCVFVIGFAFFYDSNRMVIFPISKNEGLIGYGILVLIGLILWYRLINNKQDKLAIILYQAFYYWIPFVISIIKIIFFDDLYIYEGGMFPGLEALGGYLCFIFTAAFSVTGCIVFNIVRVIVAKKNAKGLKKNNVLAKIYDVINVLLVIIAVLLIVGFGIELGVESVKKHNYKIELSKNEEYRKQVLEGLKKSERYHKAIYDDPEEQLCYEAYTYSLYVEMISENNEMPYEGDESIGVTEISEEVLKKGSENYTNFLKQYKPIRGVEMSNQDFLFDEKTQTVSVSSELYCEDEENNSIIDACMVVVFDKEWRVVDIFCQTEALNQYVPY